MLSNATIIYNSDNKGRYRSVADIGIQYFYVYYERGQMEANGKEIPLVAKRQLTTTMGN